MVPSPNSAVFSRQNPFQQDPPIGKTHYHPSKTRNLSNQTKNIVLSPIQQTPPTTSSPRQTRPLSPEDKHFLKEANNFAPFPPITDGQQNFLESWPSTDVGSSPTNTTTSSNAKTPTQIEPAASGQEDEHISVLSRYIERFRHGQPLSREQRQHLGAEMEEGQQTFWWMSPSPFPPSSTPTQTKDKDLSLDITTTTLSPVGKSQQSSTLTSCRPHELLDFSAMVLSDSSQCELGDPEILNLQERAGRLLHRSENSTSSGSIPISSEGLGCSDFSSPVSVDEPSRRPMFSNLIDSVAAVPLEVASCSKPSMASSSVCTNPKEDILFQWRLKRKMEQARQWPQSLPQQHFNNRQPSVNVSASLHQPPSSWQSHKQLHTVDPSHRVTASFTPSYYQKIKAVHGPFTPAGATSLCPSLPVSSPTVSNLISNTAVTAHTHSPFDILPCPTEPSLPSTKRNLMLRQVISGPNLVSRQPEETKYHTTNSSSEEPISKHESSPPIVSSEITEEEWPVHQKRVMKKSKDKPSGKELVRNEKKIETSSRKQRKYTRHHGDGDGDQATEPRCAHRHVNCHTKHQNRDKPFLESSRTDATQQDISQVLPQEGRSGDRAPPPSPIHSVLGQVVSEVLFSTPDLHPAPTTPVSSDSHRYSSLAPPQSPVPLSNLQCPLGVISQLLQEAEDSDEIEFKEDPLLQVLRKQRKLVKEQISEMDYLLDDFQE